MNKGFSLKIAFIVLTLISVTACAAPEQGRASDQPLRVEYTYWWGDFTILIAQELGLFAKYGVQVEPVYYESFEASYPDLAAGIIDGGLYALDDAINNNDHTPLKAVAVYDDGGFSFVIGSPEIKNPSDLRGKRIGVNVGTISELFVLETLQSGGLTIKDVTLIDMAVEDVPSNLGIAVDAGYVWEPFASEALDRGANLLLKSGGTNTITPDVIVFGADVVQQRPEDVRAFLKAWFEAVDFRNANPDAANLIIAQALGITAEELSADSQLFTVNDNKIMYSGEQQEGSINLERAFQANVDFLLRLGTLNQQPAMNSILEPAFLP